MAIDTSHDGLHDTKLFKEKSKCLFQLHACLDMDNVCLTELKASWKPTYLTKKK